MHGGVQTEAHIDAVKSPHLPFGRGGEDLLAIFYTGGVGAGALSPILYGMIGDRLSVPVMMLLRKKPTPLLTPLTASQELAVSVL